MIPLVWSLTRPCPEEWVKKFKQAGMGTVHLPFVKIEPVSDFSAVDSGLKNLDSYQGMVFTSRHAVRIIADRVRALGLSVAVPIYAVGPSTASQIESLGWKARMGDDPISGTDLARWLGERLSPGNRLLFPKSAASRMAPWNDLAKKGIQVDGVDLYRPRPIWSEEGSEVRHIFRDDPAWIVFGSPSAVEGWINVWGSPDRAGSRLESSRVCAPGKSTKDALERMGITPGIVPSGPTADAICRAIYERLRSERHEPVG